MLPAMLIVEDDPDQLEFLTRGFLRSGYQVVGVSHPRQALEAASFRQFQIALLDSSLPEMDGIELMHRVNLTQDDIRRSSLHG